MNRRTFACCAIVVLLVANGVFCRRFCASERSQRSPWPYLTDDHTLHYASAVATRHFLRDSGADAGYDPFFMGGYAKSAIWPTNALLELLVFATPGLDPAQVFKFFVWLAAASIPLALVYAGWRFGTSAGVTLLGLVFWIVQYWSAIPFQTFQYIQFGMAAFIWSVALTLAAGAAFAHWRRVQSWSAACEMAALAALAFMAHPTTGYLLGIPAAAVFVFDRSLHDRRSFFQALFAIAFVLAANYWWVVPLVLLRNTWGGAPAFFKNDNVIERLGDLFRLQWESWFAAPPLHGVLLLLALLSVRRFGPVPLAMIGWLFLLSIPGGWIDALTSLQLGRNTIHLMAWVSLPAASELVAFWETGPVLPRLIATAAASWCGLFGAARTLEHFREVLIGGHSVSSAKMFPNHQSLIEELRRQAPSARRLLFEVYEGRSIGAQGADNPWGSFRLAPLLPGATGLEVVGGPYLTTHYQTNWTNCGEGLFVGRKAWNRSDAELYFQAYALDMAVLWSPEAVAFAASNPDLFESVAQIGMIKVFRLRRSKAAWEKAGLRIAAGYDRITVENPNRAKGTFVLPYHATPGWTAAPVCEIRSTRLGDDPVPFLTVVNPSDHVELRFSPWTLSSAPPQR